MCVLYSLKSYSQLNFVLLYPSHCCYTSHTRVCFCSFLPCVLVILFARTTSACAKWWGVFRIPSATASCPVSQMAGTEDAEEKVKPATSTQWVLRAGIKPCWCFPITNSHEVTIKMWRQFHLHPVEPYNQYHRIYHSISLALKYYLAYSKGHIPLENSIIASSAWPSKC